MSQTTNIHTNVAVPQIETAAALERRPIRKGLVCIRLKGHSFRYNRFIGKFDFGSCSDKAENTHFAYEQSELYGHLSRSGSDEHFQSIKASQWKIDDCRASITAKRAFASYRSFPSHWKAAFL